MDGFAGVVRAGDTVFDVGANVGFYTLLAARLVGDDGIVQQQFEWAASEERVLITHNRVDFENLARVWWSDSRTMPELF